MMEEKMFEYVGRVTADSVISKLLEACLEAEEDASLVLVLMQAKLTGKK